MELQRTQVENISDFMNYTNLHRRRVYLIGLDIYKNFQSQFPNVELETLGEFLEMHDMAKVLKEDDRYVFGDKLYHFAFGKQLNPSTQKIVDFINTYDFILADGFFKNKNIEDEKTIGEYLRIESLADNIDRGLNPMSAEEFGKKLKAPSLFMKEPADVEIARFYEVKDRYDSLVDDLKYLK